jgi:hypothetical protein
VAGFHVGEPVLKRRQVLLLLEAVEGRLIDEIIDAMRLFIFDSHRAVATVKRCALFSLGVMLPLDHDAALLANLLAGC